MERRRAPERRITTERDPAREKVESAGTVGAEGQMFFRRLGKTLRRGEERGGEGRGGRGRRGWAVRVLLYASCGGLDGQQIVN